MPDTRRRLIDRLMCAEGAYTDAANWARYMAERAPQSGCHRAAVLRAERAHLLWVKCRDDLDDFDDDPEARAFHRGLADKLMEAHRG